jgi:hypothetical protein
MLFRPTDIQLASEIFGANCGPVSFAAYLGRNVCNVMRHFRHFPDKQWTTVGQMEEALTECDAPWERVGEMLPEAGLALIEFVGPWSKHWAGRLKRAHWVACCKGRIFDINDPSWVMEKEWRSVRAPSLVAEIPRCSGWAVMVGLDILSHAACRPRNHLWSGTASAERACATVSA